MKTVPSIFCLIMLITLANNVSALTMISPQGESTYYVGQTLTVELQAGQEEEIEQLFIVPTSFEGAILNSPPYLLHFTLSKPVIGKEKIGIFAILKNKNIITMDTEIYIKLPPLLSIKDIQLDNEISVVIMTPINSGEDTIKATGIVSDGQEYDINAFSDVTYKSLDETIAKVDSIGTVTGVYPGKTGVTIKSGSITKNIKVYVKYEVDSIKGIKASSSGNLTEISWLKSIYDGDVVTNYKIYRSKDPEGIGKKLIGDVPAGANTFSDPVPPAGVKYYYSVQAFSQKYNSGSLMKDWVTTP